MKNKFRIERLKPSKCGLCETRAIRSMWQDAFGSQTGATSAVSDVKLACRDHDVFIARDRSTPKKPVVGVLIFVSMSLCGGQIGFIMEPAARQGYEVVSQGLFFEAISFAKKKGIAQIRAPHEVFGAQWPHRETLHDLGMSKIGCHMYALRLGNK